MNLGPLLCISISILIMLFPLLHSFAKRKLDFFSPPSIFAFGFTASYGFKGWLISLDPDTFLTYSNLFDFNQKAFNEAYFLSWIGLILFFIGYYLNIDRKRFLRLRVSVRGARISYLIGLIFSLFAFFSIALLIILVFPRLVSALSFYGIQNLFVILRDVLMLSWKDYPIFYHFPVYASFFGLIAIHSKKLLVKTRADKSHQGHSITLIVTIVFLILAILGSRQILLSFVLSLLLYRHYFEKRITGQKQILILLLLVLLGGYLGIVQKSLDPSIQKVHEMAFPRNIAFRLSSSYEQFENLAGIIDRNPKLLYGQSFIEDIFITYIPRILWQSKPADFGFIRAQNVLFSDYWMLTRDTTYPIGVLGELYLNFSYIGIPLGLFLMGIMIKAIETRSMFAQTLWAPIFVTLVASFIGPHRTFGTVIMTLLLYILFAKGIQFVISFVSFAFQKQKEF